MPDPLDTPRLSLRTLGVGDADPLQAVFVAAGDYFLPITGRAAPDADAAERELRAQEAAPGRRVALLALGEEGEAAGALGWWEGHPEPDVALVGMLMVVPAHRGKGVARAAMQALERDLAARGVRRLRTGVGAADEPKHALLRALGFAPLDARTHVSLDRGRVMIALFEKEVAKSEKRKAKSER